MHFFCISSLGAELHAQQRAGTSAVQSPAFSASSVGVVALIAGLGFHLKMDFVQFLWSDTLGWHSDELSSLDR